MHNGSFSEDLDINLDQEGVFDLLTKTWPQDMLSCYVPCNFPKADAERIEEVRLFMSHVKPRDDEGVHARLSE